MMNEVWKDCLIILKNRKVDIEKTEFKNILTAILKNFKADLYFFFRHARAIDFDILFNQSKFNSFIFENGQGLGLDMNVDNDWHTISNTGLYNPYALLEKQKDFNAEVCYVTRSYLTRRGVGPLEKNVLKKEINSDMIDKTNVPNDFQGSLRYGYLEKDEQNKRINKDFSLVNKDNSYHLYK